MPANPQWSEGRTECRESEGKKVGVSTDPRAKMRIGDKMGNILEARQVRKEAK